MNFDYLSPLLLPSQINNEKELLARIADSDEPAFRILYDHYWNQVFSLAIHYLKMPDWAEDVLQEVFAKVWLKKNELTDIRSFKDFLFIIARNEMLTALRMKARKDDVYREYVKAYQEEALLFEQNFSVDIEHIIQESLFNLSPQQRTIFKLSREQGLSLEEIAQQLNISKKTVSNSLSILLAELRRCLKKNGFTLHSWLILFVLVTKP